MISIGLAILDVAIVLIISALGLRTPPKDILHLFRKPVIIGRALLSMFVFMPACTLLMTWSLPLEPAIRGSLLALSVAPLAPILSGASTKAETEGNFMLALQIISALATIVSVPLMLNLVEYIFNFETRYPMGEITWVITKQIVIPLTIGLSLSAFIGHKSERIAFWLDRIGTIALIIGMVMILSVVLPNVWGMMVNGRLLSVIAFTALVLVGVSVRRVTKGYPRQYNHGGCSETPRYCLFDRYCSTTRRGGSYHSRHRFICPVWNHRHSSLHTYI